MEDQCSLKYASKIVKYIEKFSSSQSFSEGISSLSQTLRCFNCDSGAKPSRCAVCNETFCSLCTLTYRNKTRSISYVLCFGCRGHILTKLGLHREYTQSRGNYRFNPKTNAINEPRWPAPLEVENSSCFSCRKKDLFAGERKNGFVCGLCGDVFCGDCCTPAAAVCKSVFKYPYCKQEQDFICHECYYNTHSGVNVKGTQDPKLVKKNFFDVIHNAAKDSVFFLRPEVEKSSSFASKQKVCAHCPVVKPPKTYTCCLCGLELCKMCAQFFPLPKNAPESKPGRSALCVSCRNGLLKSSGQLSLISRFKRTSNIDLEAKEFRVPDWKPSDGGGHCSWCWLSKSKKRVCNLCGNFFCKKCILSVKDPNEVFFNPLDIYHFKICFECRYYKFDGFKMVEEKAEESKDTKKARNSLKNAQILFEQTFDAKNQILMDYFNCFRIQSGLTLGKIFITDKNIYFSSQLNKSENLVIEIEKIKLLKLVGLIKNQFRLILENGISYSFSFASVFNASKHLKFLESLLKRNEVSFKKETGFFKSEDSRTTTTTISSESNSSCSFDLIKNTKMENIVHLSLPISSEELFRYSFADNAEHPLKKFLEKEGHSSVECSAWKEDEKTGLKSREISSLFELKVMPQFLRPKEKSKALRTDYLIKKKNSFFICSKVNTEGVPCSDYFEIFFLQECINESKTSCKIDVGFNITFSKSFPMLQNKIKKSSMSEYKGFLTRFFEDIKSSLRNKKGIDCEKFDSESLCEIKNEVRELITYIKLIEKRLYLLTVLCVAFVAFWILNKFSY